MKLAVDRSGVLCVSGAKNIPHEISVGPVPIGSMPDFRNFPLHRLLGHLDIALRYGVYAKSSESAELSRVDVSEFMDCYIEDGTIANMSGRVEAGKWVVYSVKKVGDCEIVAQIGIVLPLSLSKATVNILCDGVPATDLFIVRDVHFERSHWFMPVGNVFGLSCRFKLGRLPPFIMFTIEVDAASSDKERYAPIFNFTDSKMLSGMPELKRIHRVSSVNANQSSFLNGGITAYHRLASIAAKHGVQMASKDLRVLDWGVGCGRVIRHFENLATPNLWGIDIDSDNVDYCNQTLSSRAVAVSVDPPAPFEDYAFDLIYSCSVLSHLTEESTDQWLGEIGRLLSSNGIALLSFNGDSNSVSYLSRRPYELKQLMKDGFFDSDVNHELDGYVPPGYYRATFAADSWWKDRFSRFFEIVAIEHSVVNGHQDIAVLRRKRIE